MAAETGTNLRIRQHELTWRSVAGEIVALDLRSSTYFTTNASGADLWMALVEGSTAQQLTALLVTTYEISEAQAACDAAAFVKLLESSNLLERSAEPTA